MSSKPRKVIIMGAAGRDFHNFNVYFRDNPQYKVVAFTASQIPNISNRIYPPELAGKLYPEGIPIYPEDMLADLIKKYDVDEVVLAYSDLTFEDIGHKLSIVLAAGADFKIMGPKATMLESKKPVISIGAVRTGAGKSTVSRTVSKILSKFGVKVVAVRHPMPYGDLRKQIVERFETFEDIEKYECTIEEREEIEPHLENGFVVYLGVDYKRILEEAEKEADVILWDGGNNDLPFYKPDLHIVVVDPMRPGQEVGAFPGEANVRLANIVVVNKVRTVKSENVKVVVENVKRINPKATIVLADSEVTVDKPELIRGKRVVVVEDGPSVTHGHLPYGAGYVAALRYGASEIVDPRPYAVGSIKRAYEEYKHMANVVPTLGYGKEQMKELEETLNNVDADVIVLGTPSHLERYLKLNKPIVRVKFELKELSRPNLEELIGEFLKSKGLF